MKPWIDLYFNFIVYSFLGWIAQGIFVGFKKHRFVNTGFLYGPYVPIYGFGCLIIIYLIDPFFHNWFTIFLATMLLCSVLEYFTSWAMQKMFHRLWWNYAGQPFNINGRVCLLNSTLYGIAGIFVTYFSQPAVVWLRDHFSLGQLGIFEIIFSIIFSTDLFFTLKHLYETRHSIETIHKHVAGNTALQQGQLHPEVKKALHTLQTDRHGKVFADSLIVPEYQGSVHTAKDMARQADSK